MLLEEYGRIFAQIGKVWSEIADEPAEDRDGIPPHVWRKDAAAAERISSSLYIACDDLREVWSRAPADLKLSLDIKVRKVKDLPR